MGKKSVSVTLAETVKRYEKKPAERRYWYEYGYEPTGKLSLEIDHYGDGLRKTWKNGKVQTVESVLGNFISSLVDWMEYLDDKRLDSECEARQLKKAHQRRASVKEKPQLEPARRDELMSFVESSEKAERIRKYGIVQPSIPANQADDHP